MQYDILELVPHAPPMSLLDRLTLCDADNVVAEVSITDDTLFLENDVVGSWVGIEYMAQAIAAWAGYHAREAGNPVKIGFLLGSRRYTAHTPDFKKGSVLSIRAHRELQDANGLSAFACSIHCNDVLAVEATITVFQPENAAEFLKGDRQ